MFMMASTYCSTLPAPVVATTSSCQPPPRSPRSFLLTERFQAWLATLCFIPEGLGRWRFQGAQPPRPPPSMVSHLMGNFWSFCCLL